MLVQWVLQTCGTFTFNNDVLIADYLSIYLSFNNTNLGIIPRNHRGHTLNTHSVSFLYNFLYICVSVFLCPSPSFIVGTVQARKWFASECTEAYASAHTSFDSSNPPVMEALSNHSA